jgi:hypothetical protein
MSLPHAEMIVVLCLRHAGSLAEDRSRLALPVAHLPLLLGSPWVCWTDSGASPSGYTRDWTIRDCGRRADYTDGHVNRFWKLDLGLIYQMATIWSVEDR